MTAQPPESSSPASASSRRWATTSTPSGAASWPVSRASARSPASTPPSYKVHIAAEVKDFDAEDYIDKRKVRRLDLFSRYAVAAAKNAAADADFDREPRGGARAARSSAAASAACRRCTSEIEKLIEKGPDRTNPLLVPMMIPNMGAAHVSLELGTKGPLSATCTACAAGSDAIGYAARLIRARRRRSDVRRRQRGAHQPGRRGRLRRRARAEHAQRRPHRRLAALRRRPRRLRDRRGRRLPGARGASSTPRPAAPTSTPSWPAPA